MVLQVIKNEQDAIENGNHTRNHIEGQQKITENSKCEVPDGGYGWVIVTVSFLASTVVDGIVNSFGIFLSDLVKEFKESEGNIAWVGSILAGTTLLVGPLASAMANRFGCRMTCITGSLLTSGAFAISIFSPTVIWLMTTYFVAGIGLGFILLPSIVFVGYYFESKRALATGIALSGSGFGTFIYPPIMNYISGNYSWKVANLLISGSALCCVIFGILMKPLKCETDIFHAANNFLAKNEIPVMEDKEIKSTSNVSFPTMGEYMLYNLRNTSQMKDSSGLRSRSQSNAIEYYAFKRRKSSLLTRNDLFYSGSLIQLNIPTQKNTESSWKEYISLLIDKKFALFGLTNIFAMISFYIPLVYIVDCATYNSIEAGKASFLISVIGIINTIARVAFGYIVNFPMVNPICVNNICLLIASVAVVLIPQCHSYMAFIFASVFFGTSIAAYSSLTTIILVDIVGLEQLTNSFGLIQLFRGVSTLLGTPMAGALHDWTHSYNIPFFVGGAILLVSTIFGLTLQYIDKKRPIILDTANVT